MAGNQRLAALMTEAGFLDRSGTIGRKRFARAVTDAGSSCGIRKAYSHTYVTRWLNGVTPRNPETRESITIALSRALGRKVLASEVGFADGAQIRTDVGLKYPEDPESAIEQLSLLLSAELVDPRLESVTHVGAWSEASLSWLVGGMGPTTLRGDIPRVTTADVKRLRATRDLFDKLDSQFGGGHARRALLEYLRGDLPNLLRAGASGSVHRELLAAAAEATQLAAWS